MQAYFMPLTLESALRQGRPAPSTPLHASARPAPHLSVMVSAPRIMLELARGLVHLKAGRKDDI